MLHLQYCASGTNLHKKAKQHYAVESSYKYLIISTDILINKKYTYLYMGGFVICILFLLYLQSTDVFLQVLCFIVF